ncbi:MAG: T9SS type A sorting domain-containing protein [Saprospiraceae bacterium]|nr:T9SS type A sorting domain-containing protein [Saprospiraceae bacterium]
MKKSNYFLSIIFISMLFSFSALHAQWTNYTTADGLAKNDVLSVMADNQGNLWFGTNGSGVSKFTGTTWTTYTTSQGLGSNIVNAILQDNQNNIWFATENGVTKFTGSTWTTYTTSNGIGANIIKSLALDANGKVWVGTQMGGVSRNNSGSSWTTFKKATTSNGLAHDFVSGMTCDLQGNMWFATSDGISRYTGSAWTAYNSSNGLGPNSYVAISAATDSSGKVWFGSQPGFGIGGGVNMYDGTWHYYTTSNGLANNEVKSIAATSLNVWFGTNNYGASKYNGTTFTTYNTVQGLVNNNVKGITVDSQGNIWFATAGGVSKLESLAINSVVVKHNTCNQTANGKIVINAGGLNSPLYYSINNGMTYQASKTFTGLAPGTYHVAVTDSSSFVFDTLYTIINIPMDVLELGNDTAICEGDSIQLMAPPYATYTWSPTNLITNSLIHNPMGFPDTTTIFRVEVIDTNQCFQYDSIIVDINPLPAAPMVTILDSLFTAPAGFTYKWYSYNNIIPGATSQTYIATSPGIYYCEIYNSNGCHSKSGMLHYNNTSINSIENENNYVHVFPNPSNGLINIEIQNSDLQNIIIEVLNINGQIVLSKSFDNPFEYSQTTLDLNMLNQGVYMLRTYNESFINTTRIIINK